MHIDFSKFDRCHILVVGDLMIDEYVWGAVDRISPEAPVQVLTVRNEEHTLGGSGNVVNNLTTLGAKVSVFGVTGKGMDGKLLLDQLNDLNVDTRGIIKESSRITTKKTRIIADRQQVLRIDRETNSEISSPTTKALNELAAKIIPEVDVVLISDYGKGLITRPLIAKVVEIAKSNSKITIADPKGLDFANEQVSEMFNNLQKYPNNNKFYYEALNMVETALLIINGAIERKDSLGCHYRIN